MPYYGKVTPEILENVFKGLEVENDHLARLLVFMVDKIKTADRLPKFEQVCIKDYLLSIGIDTGLENVLVVQVSQKEVTENVFRHPQTTARAWNKLRDSEIVEEVLKGFPGHSTVFLLGFINSQIMKDDVSEDGSDNEISLTNNDDSLTNDDESTHKRSTFRSQSNSVIRENAETSIINQSYPENKPVIKASNSEPHKERCPNCGSESYSIDDRSGCCYCPECSYIGSNPNMMKRMREG